MSQLTTARYGKDNIRLYKVNRHSSGLHEVCEMTLRVMLSGGISSAYTAADNSVVVTTDTMKNTVYILAKQQPAITPPELFATIVGQHFIDTYAHINEATVSITVHRWTRIELDGTPHPHSFIRDGAETRNVEVTVSEAKGVDVRSSIEGMLLLKSTGSQFYGYIKDEYTTLPETWDRVLSTEIDCSWTWSHFPELGVVKSLAAKGEFDRAWRVARDVTIRTFAEESSASVQDTTYLMAGRILEDCKDVMAVSYSLPNKHYFEISKFLREIVARLR